MKNKNLKIKSERCRQLVPQAILENCKILFQELTFEVEDECIFVRGRLSSYYALQRLLSNIKQMFSSKEGRYVYPVHIWVCVGPKRSIFETLFTNKDDNKS